MIEFLGLIPARGGSKTIPRKNIKPLNGKPLIAYTIEAALQCPAIKRLVVSTDDEEIGRLAEQYGAEFLFLRPKELAQDSTGDLPVLNHTIEWFEKNEDATVNKIIYLRPTTPFKSPQIIDACIKKMASNRYTSLRTVTAVNGVYHPFWMFKPDGDILRPFCNDGNIQTYYQRQLLPQCYRLNGVVDIVKSDLVKQQDLYGSNIGYVELDELESIDIDSPLDFQLAEFFVRVLNK